MSTTKPECTIANLAMDILDAATNRYYKTIFQAAQQQALDRGDTRITPEDAVEAVRLYPCDATQSPKLS